MAVLLDVKKPARVGGKIPEIAPTGGRKPASNPSRSAAELNRAERVRLSGHRISPFFTEQCANELVLFSSAIERGDPHAAEQLLPLVYDELRKLAAQKMASEQPGQTLQATALVHEAYLRLVAADQAQRWEIGRASCRERV